MKKITRALISVSDKTGIVDFAKQLVKLEYSLISTGGTGKTLADNNISFIPIQDVITVRLMRF